MIVITKECMDCGQIVVRNGNSPFTVCHRCGSIRTQYKTKKANITTKQEIRAKKIKEIFNL